MKVRKDGALKEKESYLHHEVEKYANTKAVQATKIRKEAHCIMNRENCIRIEFNITVTLIKVKSPCPTSIGLCNMRYNS